MIRVVADTNVYVSAILFGGTCETILALARAGVIELCVSPALRCELRLVLKHTFRWPPLQVREALAELSALTSVVRPAVRLSSILPHDPDHRVLECALAARAEFLVTGDRKHLQPLQSFRGLPIVSPRAFLDLLRK